MRLEFGAIVLVAFPFTDQTASKKHPAVVISSQAYNDAKPDLVIMAITSQFRPVAALGEVWLSHWQQAGLLKPSVIKPLFATIEQRLMIRQLGTLQAADQIAARQTIAEVLG
jgi:mRNA interferase MazF